MNNTGTVHTCKHEIMYMYKSLFLSLVNTRCHPTFTHNIFHSCLQPNEALLGVDKEQQSVFSSEDETTASSHDQSFEKQKTTST